MLRRHWWQGAWTGGYGFGMRRRASYWAPFDRVQVQERRPPRAQWRWEVFPIPQASWCLPDKCPFCASGLDPPGCSLLTRMVALLSANFTSKPSWWTINWRPDYLVLSAAVRIAFTGDTGHALKWRPLRVLSVAYAHSVECIGFVSYFLDTFWLICDFKKQKFNFGTAFCPDQCRL